MKSSFIRTILLAAVQLTLVALGDACSGNSSRSASTGNQSIASPGYNSSGVIWYSGYDCTYTINGGQSTDKVIVWIQDSDVQYNDSTYLYIYNTENADTVTISSNGYVNNYYYRSSSLTFRFYAADWSNNTGGYEIRYQYNRVDYVVGSTINAYYNYTSIQTLSHTFSDNEEPYFSTQGTYTFTLRPSNGDRVIAYVYSQDLNNINYVTIEGVGMTTGTFHQDGEITIVVNWQNQYNYTYFSIVVHVFSTYSMNYLTGCSGSTPSYTASQVSVSFIHSPHHPGSYYQMNRDYVCTYEVHADASTNFVGFLVQYTYLESGDHLYIYDGDGSTLFHSNGASSGFILSKTDHVRIQFTSDDSSETTINNIPVSSYNGFRIRYISVAGQTLSQPAFILNSVPDEYTFLVTDETDTSALHPPFASTYDTYRNNILYWMIRAPCKSYQNEITVLFLDLDGSGDSLRVYDGNTLTSSQLLGYSYQRNGYETSTFTITSSGQYALVRFSIDGSNDNNHGWILTYKIKQWSTPAWYGITNVTFPPSFAVDSVCAKTGRTLIGYCPWTYSTISSPNFPNVYDHNLTCEWLLEAEDIYYIIQVDFQYFDVENQTYCVYDYLQVYDGAYVLDKDLLNTFCGPNLPPTQKSGTQWLRLRFHSDYSLQYSGFQFTYKSVNITEEQCYIAYDNYMALNATTSPQSFSSQNYPNYYPNNHDSYWMIENPQHPTAKLVLKITDINIEVAAFCKYDRIMIYEGKCATSRVIHTYCSKRPKIYELTTSKYYLIRHHTDYNIVKEGFRINYYYITSVTAGTTTITTTTAGPCVSRVVQLMNELTNASFYNNENVPMKDLNYASPATISFELTSIMCLNEKRGKLTSVGKFTLQWLDEFLVWEPAKKSNITYFYIPQDEVWKPSLALVNAYSGVQKMGDSFLNVHVTYNGTVTWTPKHVLQSNCKIDLTYYPYDEQVCQLKFRLWAMDNSDINFTLASKGFYISSEYQEDSRWTLMYSNYSQEILSDRNMFTLNVRLKRNAGFQLYYLMLPMISLAGLNLFAFVLPPESEEKCRLSILIFCGFLLSNVIQNKEMPKHSTGLSLLTMYSIILFFNSFFIFLLSLIVLRIAHFRDKISPPGLYLSKFARAVSGLRSLLTCFYVRDNDPCQQPQWKQVASAIEFVFFWLFSIYYATITAYFYARIVGNGR